MLIIAEKGGGVGVRVNANNSIKIFPPAGETSDFCENFEIVQRN